MPDTARNLPGNGPLRVGVVGVGHMGRLHVRTYRRMADAAVAAGREVPVILAGVVDADPARAAKVAEEFAAPALATPDELLGRVDAVSIAVPTRHHARVAEPFLARRIPVLVEKPLASTRAEAEALVDLARRHECLLAVGHSERFNPAVMALDRLTIRPKYIECRRVSSFSFRSLDIGVVLDMMIHDIDIMLHLARSEPLRVDAIGVNIVDRHEDVANARIVFADGCVASLTGSRLAFKTERQIRVFSEEAYISLDYGKRQCRIIKKGPKLDLAHMARQAAAAEGAGQDPAAFLSGMDFGDLLTYEELPIDDHEPLLKELEEFLDCVRTGRRPRVSEIEGYQAVACAERILDSIRAHQWDGRPDGRIGLAGPVRG